MHLVYTYIFNQENSKKPKKFKNSNELQNGLSSSSVFFPLNCVTKRVLWSVSIQVEEIFSVTQEPPVLKEPSNTISSVSEWTSDKKTTFCHKIQSSHWPTEPGRLVWPQIWSGWNIHLNKCEATR